jgi:branched-subunit amino acid aminotransferase/4-amino-4-deoxychorismate lyase
MKPPSYLPHAMVNGRLLATVELRVSPLGDGFMFGHGLFETIKVQGGLPVLLEDHWARLAKSAGELGLGVIGSERELRSRCVQVAAANKLLVGALKVIVFQEVTEVSEIIFARAGLYAPEQFTAGFRLRTVPGTIRSGKLFAQKTLNYLHNITAKNEAVAAGFDEALFVDEVGNLLEGATSNVFVVRGGRVHTPPCDGRILPGVARGRLLRLLGYRAHEKTVSMALLSDADEVFVTNALLGIMPVACVDEHVFDLNTNPVTRELMATYKAEEAKRSDKFVT